MVASLLSSTVVTDFCFAHDNHSSSVECNVLFVATLIIITIYSQLFSVSLFPSSTIIINNNNNNNNKTENCIHNNYL